MSFTLVDICVVGGIVLFALISGFWGFVGLAAGIGSWAGAVAIAVLFYPEAQELTRSMIDTTLFADIAAGAGLFAGSLVVLLILGSILSGSVRKSALGPVNRALGFAAGLGVGYLIACIMLIGGILLLTEDGLPRSVSESRSYAFVRAGGVALISTMPEHARTDAMKALGAARDGMNEASRTKELYDKLNAPKPKAADSDSQDSGYGDEERSELQTIIDEIAQ